MPETKPAGHHGHHAPSGASPPLLAITAILIIVWLILVINHSKEIALKVGTGEDGGTLAEISPAVVTILNSELGHAIGIEKIFTDELNRVQFKIQANSKGTFENVENLKSGKIDLAIIYEGIVPRVTLDSELRTFARLYVNPLHVIASTSSGIENFDDIKPNHIVGRPPENVASFKRANNVLDHYGIMESNGFEIEPCGNFYECASDLKAEELDIAFFGGAIPIPSVDKFFTEEAARFRFVPIKASRALVMRYPVYTVFTIPAMSYAGNPPFPRTDTVTIASVASLVGRADLEDRLGESKIYRMTRALFDSATYLSNRYPYMAAMTEDFASDSPEYPLFEGSLDYYDRNKPIPWDMVTLWVSSAFSLIFLTITLYQYYVSRHSRKT